ncbi:MAG TPA: c-type cytochrome [Terriglobales bacterium]|nr:c-type cytochrome [Terriglobales bacterium]
MKAAVALSILTVLTVLLASCDNLSESRVRAAYITTGGGNARAGRDAIRKYGCYACHTIDGVPGAHGLVGPPLNGLGSRQFIAGELPNTPANLTRWVQHPRQVEPHTLMPEMGVTEDDSRDIAAYLYTLRAPH